MNSAGRQAGLEAPLLELAAQQATGCLVVTDDAGEEALVWLRDGDIYAVSVPGRRPLLGVRLVSSGAITPEVLAEALEVQRTELRGWRLGELLVHLGYVERPVIDDFATEQLNDQLAGLLGWPVRMSRFRNGEHTRRDLTLPRNVSELLDEARARRIRWAAVLDRVGGADTVPDLDSSAPPATQSDLGPHEWALLCKVDGGRSLAELADECGFTLFETARLVADLTEAGLVTVARPEHPPGPVTEPAEPGLAKVLQLHPPEPEPEPLHHDGQPIVVPEEPLPDRPSVEADAEPGFDSIEPWRVAPATADGWAQMAEAANLLSEFAVDNRQSDLLDTELLAEPSDGEPGAWESVAPLDAQPEPEAEAEAEADAEPEAEPEPEPEPEEQPTPAAAGGEFTDTASLLRELSSLGNVATDDAGPRLTSTPRPGVTNDPRSRKKRGFLGR